MTLALEIPEAVVTLEAAVIKKESEVETGWNLRIWDYSRKFSIGY